MAGVATQMTIRDGMTSKLNRIFQAVSRTNRALETTDALSDQVNPGANFDRAASAAGRASGQVDNFNNRQRQSEEGARKVASAWGLVKKAIGSALAAISVQKVIELADSMTSTRARLDIMNDGLQTTDELQSMIMKSANRSRAAYQTTADAVSKMGIMAKDAFSNNDELIKFTESNPSNTKNGPANWATCTIRSNCTNGKTRRRRKLSFQKRRTHRRKPRNRPEPESLKRNQKPIRSKKATACGISRRNSMAREATIQKSIMPTRGRSERTRI